MRWWSASVLPERLSCDQAGAAAAAARVRALVPSAASVAPGVAEIVEAVRTRGDAAVLDVERRFGAGTAPLRVPADELTAAAEALHPDLRAGLEVAIANVAAVARAGLA